MATNTPNLVLRKPDGVDLVNVLADLDANFDKIDAMFDAWTTYTPVWGAAGTAPVLGNGTIVGRYRKVGKFLDFTIVLTLGTTSTVGTGAWSVSLPASLTAKIFQYQAAGVVSKATAGSFSAMTQYGPAGNTVLILVPASATATSLNYVSSALPTGAWASNDSVNIGGRIELT